MTKGARVYESKTTRGINYEQLSAGSLKSRHHYGIEQAPKDGGGEAKIPAIFRRREKRYT